MGTVIEFETGALALGAGRIDAATTRAVWRASPMAAGAQWRDMGTGWVHAQLPAETHVDRSFGVRLLFEGERLEGYDLYLLGPEFNTSWDDWSEVRERARVTAHDRWLAQMLGAGTGTRSPERGELVYRLPWGEASSTYDPRSASSAIVVRFRR